MGCHSHPSVNLYVFQISALQGKGFRADLGGMIVKNHKWIWSLNAIKKKKMYCLEENVLWHRKGAIWEDQAKAV